MTEGHHDEPLTLTSIRLDALQVPRVTLHVQPKTQPAFQHPLGVAPCIIGSHPSCNVVLPDERVSRRHCELSFGSRGVVVRDLESRNGTYIGTIAVTEAVLPIGTPLMVGDCQLTLVQHGGAATVALSRAVRFGEALGASFVMRELFAKLERAAASAETIVLLGESGTGKELLARGIHDHSPRRDLPFEIFDCSAAAPTLIESALFGHVRGAFTGASRDHSGVFERAGRGTVFLDEIGELPLELQPKLLRALEARTFQPVGGEQHKPLEAQVVAATHRDLLAQVAEGEFRQDLYYRLAVLELEVPPLRQRKDDIPLLVERFLAQLTPPRSLADMPANLMRMLQAHAWPGNVRELRNTVARLSVFSQWPEQAIAPTSRPSPASAPQPQFSEAAPSSPALQPSPAPLASRLPWREARSAAIEDFERGYLDGRLRAHAGNVAKTAASMGVTRQFLYRLLERHGLRPS